MQMVQFTNPQNTVLSFHPHSSRPRPSITGIHNHSPTATRTQRTPKPKVGTMHIRMPYPASFRATIDTSPGDDTKSTTIAAPGSLLRLCCTRRAWKGTLNVRRVTNMITAGTDTTRIAMKRQVCLQESTTQIQGRPEWGRGDRLSEYW